MTDLAPICALGGAAPRIAHHGALTLAEVPDLALASLALRRGATRPAPFGLDLPGPGGWTEGGSVAAFWTGPDQWMIEAPNRAGEDFAAILAGDAPRCSVTDQTDAFAAIEVTAAEDTALVRMLEKLVNLDPAVLAPGRATRTGLHHMAVFVIRRDATRLAVLGMRSAAGSLWHALEIAAARAG